MGAKGAARLAHSTHSNGFRPCSGLACVYMAKHKTAISAHKRKRPQRSTDVERPQEPRAQRPTPTPPQRSMRETFLGYHRLTVPEIDRIWGDCVFALDTNVLLNIYRYESATRDDLFRVLRHLRGRVWVPFQVAQEFYANRVDVIREQSAKFDQLSKTVEAVLTSLNDGAFKKSGFLRVTEVDGLLQPAIANALQFIGQQRAAHPDLIKEDPYLETLVEIIAASLGKAPSADATKKGSGEAQGRIDRKQPPGYRDEKKPAPDRYGDVFIWFELLQLAQDRKRPVVFVTDDDKDDWWQIVDGQKLGPRPELRQEMRKAAGVDFYIYNPARLKRFS